MAMCYNEGIVRDKPLGVPANTKLVYWKHLTGNILILNTHMQWNGFVWQQTFNYQLTCNTTTALQCMRDNKFPINQSDEKFCGDQFLIELQLTIQFHWFVIYQ